MNGMIVLVTVMSLTVGKTRGQLTTVPGAINVRLFSPFPLDPRTFIVQEQASPRSQKIPRRIPVLQSSTDRLEQSAKNSGDINLRPLTLETRPNRKIFTPERRPARTNRPDTSKIDSTTVNVDQNYPVKNQVDMNQNSANTGGNRSNLAEQNGTPATKPVTTNKPGDPVASVVQNEPLIDSSGVNGSKEMNGTTGSGKPTSPSVIDKATGVEVTLDERASFDGDKCPTGYVRINGMCVEKD